MGLQLPILLLLLCCVSGLPFYNGFYYSNRPNGRNLDNGYSEGGWPLGSALGSALGLGR